MAPKGVLTYTLLSFFNRIFYMSFFITLLLFVLLWPLVKVIYYVIRTRRYIRRQQEDFRRAYSDAYAGRQGNPSGGPAPHRRRKKVFSKTDGEYVDFEEIVCDVESTDPQPDTEFYREEQVSDAEWTEIK